MLIITDIKERLLERYKGNICIKDDNEYVNVATPITFICKEHGEFITKPKVLFKGKYGCPICAKEHNKRNTSSLTHINNKVLLYTSDDIEHYIKAYSDDLSLVQYTDKAHPIIIRCPKHGEFVITYKQLLRRKHICYKCGKEHVSALLSSKAISEQEFIKRSNIVHNNEYDYSLVNFAKQSRDKVPIICRKHGVFYQDVWSHLRPEGCPICKRANKWITQKRFHNLLVNEFPNLTIKEQQSFKWLGRYSLDYYIEELNLGIEYHGSQHFVNNNWFSKLHNNNDNLIITQQRDLNKFNLCKEHNIEILYFTFWKEDMCAIKNYFCHVYTELNDIYDAIYDKILGKDDKIS